MKVILVLTVEPQDGSPDRLPPKQIDQMITALKERVEDLKEDIKVENPQFDAEEAEEDPNGVEVSATVAYGLIDPRIYLAKDQFKVIADLKSLGGKA